MTFLSQSSQASEKTKQSGFFLNCLSVAFLGFYSTEYPSCLPLRAQPLKVGEGLPQPVSLRPLMDPSGVDCMTLTF